MQKKIIIFLAFCLLSISTTNLSGQILNQAATWPNVTWTVGGTYTVTSLLNDPTITTNFSFNDDAAGTGSPDTVTAESPIINLTAAHTGGETLLNIDFNYDYNLGDVFQLEYYDAAAAGWVLWEVLPDNSSTTTAWCAAISAPAITSADLNISSFTATQLSGFQYRFYYESTVTWGWGVCVSTPTITSVAPATCSAPSTLVPSAILATTANLGWTENGTAISWEVEYGAAGFTQGTGTSALTAINPHFISGLTATTQYDFYVRAICGPADTSIWAGPVTFATTFNTPLGVTCVSGGSASFVFSDDMETAVGWTGDVGTGNTQWDFPTINPGGNSTSTGPSAAQSGATYAEFEASGITSDTASMVTPMIDLVAATDAAELSFYMHAFGADLGKMNVGVGTSPVGPFTTVFSSVGQYQTAATDPWAHVGVNISAYLGQQIYIEFSYAALSSGFEGDMSIDLVQVEVCINCPVPSTLTTTGITATSANLGWTEHGSAASWEVEYGPSPLTPGTGTAVVTGTNPHSLTSLTSNTSYDFYVRAICGPADSSTWAGPFTFGTPISCLAPTALTVTTPTTTTANLGWTENGTAISWEVEYGLSPLTPGTGTAVVTGTNPHSLTSLTANTSYDFYVRAICGPADSSSWSGPLTFSTPCIALTAPWTESFTGTIPACWNQGASNGESWLFNIPGASHIGNIGTLGGTTTSGVNFAWVDDSNIHNTGTTLESPLVDVSALTTPTLSFYLIKNNEGFSNVEFSVDVWDGAAWNTDFYVQDSNTVNGEWEEIILSLSSLTITGPVQLRFIVDENNGTDFYDDAAIDDVSIIEAVLPPTPQLMITEIMYNSPEAGIDSLEFIEIHNNGPTSVDVSNWTLTGGAYTFPAATNIAAGGFYVVAINSAAFTTIYSAAPDGQFTGGLSNGGESIVLKNATGMTIDSLRYDDNTPWPSGATAGQPDGGGASIVLCNTTADNSNGANWAASPTATGATINFLALLASPGAANSCTATDDVSVSGFYNLMADYCHVASISGGVIITNITTNPVTNVPYTIMAGGVTIGSGAIGTLAGSASDTIIVGPLPGATGSFPIVAWTAFSGDVNTNNDTMMAMVNISNTTAAASVTATLLCNSDSTGIATAMGSDGLGMFMYMWDTTTGNQATAIATGLMAGTYMVTITDSIGCADTAMVTLAEPTAVTATDSVMNVICNSDSTGMVIITPSGGSPGYTFMWGAGGTTGMAMNLAAGVYNVTVMDTNGCMTMVTSTITESSAVVASAVDNANGSATASGTGGTGGYTFMWDASAANQTVATATGLVNNTYNITVADVNGCMDTVNITITGVGFNNIANVSNLNMFPNPTSGNLFVELDLINNADVNINITNTIGQLVASKVLNNVQSKKVELETSNLPSGVYVVQFTIGQKQLTRKLIVSKQ